VNEQEWEKFRNAGLQQIPKEDDEGNKFVRFRRSVRKVFPKDDEATYWNPPEITGEVNVSYVDADTKERVKTFKKSEKRNIETVGEKTPIGNDSEGIINLCVYDSGKGKGHRWESLKVTKLVEYNPDANEKPKDETPEVEEEKKGVKKKTPVLKEELNDEIPW
jgi:hypothetical protein